MTGPDKDLIASIKRLRVISSRGNSGALVGIIIVAAMVVAWLVFRGG